MDTPDIDFNKTVSFSYRGSKPKKQFWDHRQGHDLGTVAELQDCWVCHNTLDRRFWFLRTENFIPFTGTHEPNKLTSSHLSGFIAQLVSAQHRHRRGHGFDSRLTYETITDIVQQLWRSFLQFISQPHFANISFTNLMYSKVNNAARTQFPILVSSLYGGIRRPLRSFKALKVAFSKCSLRRCTKSSHPILLQSVGVLHKI